MTEADWNSCTDPQEMLRFLQSRGLSGRKKRLLACAICRLIWFLLPDARSREAVEVAERFADGQSSVMELEIAQVQARAAIPTRHPSRGVSVGGKEWRAGRLVQSVTRAAWYTTINPISSITPTSRLAEIARQRGIASGFGFAQLLRCICHPFQTVPINCTLLTSTVVSLAQAIYDNRAFDRMPVLADALEESGCTNEEMLEHCRGGGEHVRGCWMVDLVLGKS